MTDDPLRDLTLYLDAFLLGVGYQERGGHR